MKELWNLLWNDDLSIIEVDEKDYIKDKCIACNRTRHLTYEITKESTDEILGIMGVDCYEIKFQTIIDLVETCKRGLVHRLHRVDFDSYARAHLMGDIRNIQEAPMKMKRHYA